RSDVVHDALRSPGCASRQSAAPADPTDRRSAIPSGRRGQENAPAVIDRLPPQSIEAEQSVLGSILIDRDVIVEIAEFLRPDDFYRNANGQVYGAMLELFERREPVDIVTVAEALERAGQLDDVGGRTYLSSLSNQTPTAVHAIQYAKIVERKAVLRNLI